MIENLFVSAKQPVNIFYCLSVPFVYKFIVNLYQDETFAVLYCENRMNVYLCIGISHVLNIPSLKGLRFGAMTFLPIFRP